MGWLKGFSQWCAKRSEKTRYGYGVDQMQTANTLRDFADSIEAGAVEIISVQYSDAAAGGCTPSGTVTLSFVLPTDRGDLERQGVNAPLQW